MSFKKQNDPIKAPWPPGVDVRTVSVNGWPWLQLRPGACLSHRWFVYYFIGPQGHGVGNAMN